MSGANEDQNVGVGIAKRALTAPLRQIAENAGDEGSVVLNQIRGESGNYGLRRRNAASTATWWLLASLTRPRSVRTALQSAASVAGLMITTEAMVSELPEDNPPPAHGGGGMPDMGGMM